MYVVLLTLSIGRSTFMPHFCSSKFKFTKKCLKNMKMEDYEDSMEINVKSIIHLTQLCLPYLIAEKGIIN